VDLKRLARIQEGLASKVCLEWDYRDVSLVAGADFGYDSRRQNIGAVIVVYKLPEFEVLEVSQAVRKLDFPYIPSFLAFREGPVFFDAFQKISKKPDVVLVDGNGIAHPRKMGLASFVGVILDIVTIGCAKSPFFPFLVPERHRGAYTYYLNNRGEKVGLCLRTRDRVKPVFVSPGHRIDLLTSRRIVLQCSKYRIPDPLRTAHKLTRRLFEAEQP